MRSILLCDDEPKLAKVLSTALTSAGYQVERVSSGQEAIARAQQKRFDLLLTDLKLPDQDGLSVLAAIRSLPQPPDALMMTAYASAETAVSAMRLGAHDYLIKPFSIDELRIRVAQVMGRRALLEQNGQLQAKLGELQRTDHLVGSSARMQQVLDQLFQVAATDATVLLLGESGTGKSLLARVLHQHSRRRSQPLAEVHCAALPESLLEAELFGHERGAFTGAVEQRIGHIESADKGTVFLDEIGELPGSIQVKLLRVLQDKQFFRVGSSQVRSADVRFVCATNRDLAAAVRERSLREDFYYRINVFPIVVPPLREHLDDIPALAAAFLGRRHPGITLSAQALATLSRYSWPGNVRELENVLERAAILVGSQQTTRKSGGEIGILHIPASIRDGVQPIVAESLLRPGFSLDGIERELIQEALARARGNKTEAAKLLGITRRRLYSRLKSMENDAAEGTPPASSENPS